MEGLLKMADARGFKAMPLPFRVKGTIRSKIRDIETRNVAARIDGSDPQLKDQVVIFSAHWDHLGKGEEINGDAIYNGAVDNATGCAMLIEIARAWAALPQKPRRSAMFLAVTAEEGGLRGSEYYGQHPLVPVGQTAANLNFDAFYPFGRTRDVILTGAERTTLWPLVENTAKRYELEIKPDPRPEAGSYYRSDHFSMARVGVPAFSIAGGTEYLGKPADFGKTTAAEYTAKRYHQPGDEYNEDWDLSGMEYLARFGFTLGLNIANETKLPTWKAGDEFLPARVASGVK
jgi:Zn-dependent M28 family amino/carboxypeptidase